MHACVTTAACSQLSPAGMEELRDKGTPDDHGYKWLEAVPQLASLRLSVRAWSAACPSCRRLLSRGWTAALSRQLLILLAGLLVYCHRLQVLAGTALNC
jgi:hypothetical protein